MMTISANGILMMIPKVRWSTIGTYNVTVSRKSVSIVAAPFGSCRSMSAATVVPRRASGEAGSMLYTFHTSVKPARITVDASSDQVAVRMAKAILRDYGYTFGVVVAERRKPTPPKLSPRLTAVDYWIAANTQ